MEDAIRLAEEMFGELLARSRRALPEHLGDLVVETVERALGAREVVVYLVDHEQIALHPLPRLGAALEVHPLPLDTTLPGRVFRTVETLHTAVDGGRRVWLPLLDGLERIGVVGVTLPNPDDEVLDQLSRLAYLLAHLVQSKGVFGDLTEQVRRTRPMSLAAELQRGLLPPLTVGSDRATISAVFLPTYDVGGDAFDYALAPDRAQVLLVDAMGHGMDAGLMASVALAAYRNSRRRAASLLGTYRAVDTAISRTFAADQFVTGLLVELDLVTGRLQWVSAGHPPPLLLRDGRVVKTLEAPPALPFGLGEAAPEIAEEVLQPDDLLVLVTDGVLEARSGTGQFFGQERLTDFLVREAAARQPAPEALRRLSHAVLGHLGGQLSDDATTVVLHWHGAHLEDAALALRDA